MHCADMKDYFQFWGVVLQWNFNLSPAQFVAADAFDTGVVVVSRMHGNGALHCLDAARAGD